MNWWTERLDQGISRPHRLRELAQRCKKSKTFHTVWVTWSWSRFIEWGGNLSSSLSEVLHRFLGHGTHAFCVNFRLGFRLEQSGQLDFPTSALACFLHVSSYFQLTVWPVAFLWRSRNR